MKIKSVKVFLPILFFLVLGITLTTFAYKSPYYTYIDSIDTGGVNLDCLQIRPGGTSLEIKNSCPQFLYLNGTKVSNDGASGDNVVYRNVSGAWHEPSLDYEDDEIYINEKGEEYVIWALEGKLGQKVIQISG